MARFSAEYVLARCDFWGFFPCTYTIYAFRTLADKQISSRSSYNSGWSWCILSFESAGRFVYDWPCLCRGEGKAGTSRLSVLLTIVTRAGCQVVCKNIAYM
ncbi:hypothetical protein KC19_VG108500 [Ceratodon purpureus]|uniref:Uncharacterized protein n=1 Tax=Ceratodon purpureus TaxID=3225 RepID=A0A8T0HPR0_CERPU|nr:hypothetical protein KC19_VG108500 [Ceratodon purpureus]